MALLRHIDEGAFDAPLVQEIVTMAKAHPRAEVRDLFERFLPESERVERIGDSVNVDAILALDGNASRGRALFLEGNAAQCRNCHRMGGKGQLLGPDLDAIGLKYPKPEMLEHIVNPSKRVEPEYVSYLLETSTGLLYSGMLIERNDQAIELKDAQNKTIRVEATEVEQFAPQSQSLMPEGLLSPLTPQEAADLLEYLSQQRKELPGSNNERPDGRLPEGE